jgi:hypothetical protein
MAQQNKPLLASISRHGAEASRGRKRSRSLRRASVTSANCGGTGDSCTLRGRPRCRSSSLLDSASYNESTHATGTSRSPTRKPVFRMVLQDRQRNQSPSRSRSPHSCRQQEVQKRRQRTRSRSRSHQPESSHRRPEQASPLRHGISVENRDENVSRSGQWGSGS